jgi:hypothetical protein
MSTRNRFGRCNYVSGDGDALEYFVSGFKVMVIEEGISQES